MSYVDPLRAEQVNDAITFARYCQEQVGISYPKAAGIVGVRTAIANFFAAYPDADYNSLTKLVRWSKIKNKRYKSAAALINGGTRLAYIDGYLSELDPRTKRYTVDTMIDEALSVETDRRKRMELRNAMSEEGKLQAYNKWLLEKESVG